MMLYNGDCLQIMNNLPNESIDMIYLDPPFYKQKNQILSDNKGTIYSFKDVWNSINEYKNYIKIRLLEMKRILKSSGSIFLHCDNSASHHLHIILDEVFGTNNFRNEIIWVYKRWSNSQKRLLPTHQKIFFYTKTSNYKFNTIYCDYASTTNLDQILQERQKNKLGKTTYKKGTNDDIILSKNKKGVPLSDVWEIPLLNPKAKERTGYPTQKPIELLERIIKISTDESDLVLDPFCGSGTTLVSAKLLKRKYIGIDINPDAIYVSSQRLDKPFKTKSDLLSLGSSAYQTKDKDELLILNQIDCFKVQRNKGIDAFLKKYYFDHPVALKLQKKEEDFLTAVSLLQSSGTKKQCSFTVLITHEQNWSIYEKLIPNNMILINQYDIQIENEIYKKISNLLNNKHTIR